MPVKAVTIQPYSIVDPDRAQDRSIAANPSKTTYASCGMTGHDTPTKVNAKSDQEYNMYKPKKIKYGTKDIEV